MIRKSLVSLLSIGVVVSLAACGGTPEDASSPSVSEPVEVTSTATETSLPPVSESPDSSASPEDSVSPENSANPSSDATSRGDSVSTGEIPAVVQGKWITVSEGEEARQCTDELDNEGAILTIDATSMSSFAFVFELESVEESDADSIEALFKYSDDSDAPMTPMIRLETQDDWQTFEFIELGTEGQAPAIYSRCS